ncbi:MAG: hypothetical protein ACE5G3_08235 [Gammaproteobacteria bacterium]
MFSGTPSRRAITVIGIFFRERPKKIGILAVNSFDQPVRQRGDASRREGAQDEAADPPVHGRFPFRRRVTFEFVKRSHVRRDERIPSGAGNIVVPPEKRRTAFPDALAKPVGILHEIRVGRPL